MRKKLYNRILNTMVENYEDICKLLNKIYKLVDKEDEETDRFYNELIS